MVSVESARLLARTLNGDRHTFQSVRTVFKVLKQLAISVGIEASRLVGGAHSCHLAAGECGGDSRPASSAAALMPVLSAQTPLDALSPLPLAPFGTLKLLAGSSGWGRMGEGSWSTARPLLGHRRNS
jgi:hypothetical protein